MPCLESSLKWSDWGTKIHKDRERAKELSPGFDQHMNIVELNKSRKKLIIFLRQRCDTLDCEGYSPLLVAVREDQNQNGKQENNSRERITQQNKTSKKRKQSVSVLNRNFCLNKKWESMLFSTPAGTSRYCQCFGQSLLLSVAFPNVFDDLSSDELTPVAVI